MDFMAENRHKSEETDNQFFDNTKYYLTKYDLHLEYFDKKGPNAVCIPRYSAVSENEATSELSSADIDVAAAWSDGKISFINSCDIAANSYIISKEQYEHFRELEDRVANEKYQRSCEVDKIWEGDESDDVKKAQRVTNLLREPYPEKIARENELRQFLQSKGVKFEQTRLFSLRNISVPDSPKQETDMTHNADTGLTYA